MKNQIIRNLKRLASLSYQQRYCVTATKDEYVLPEEIYEQAVSIIKTAMSTSTLSNNLSETERDALIQFLKEIEFSDEQIPFEDLTVSIQDLIEQSEAWTRVRIAAERCLRELGCQEDLSTVND